MDSFWSFDADGDYSSVAYGSADLGALIDRVVTGMHWTRAGTAHRSWDEAWHIVLRAHRAASITASARTSSVGVTSMPKRDDRVERYSGIKGFLYDVSEMALLSVILYDW